MVESPQRIWIEADDECPYFYEAHELHDVEQDVIEYVRADLYAALEAKLAARTGAVKVKALVSSLLDLRDLIMRGKRCVTDTGPAVKPVIELAAVHILDDAANALEALSALEPAAPEGQPMPNPASIKAWRIKKSEPIPQWLEKTENVELTAGCDLIVIEAEDGGFDVYRADPNSFANMMEGTCTDPDKHATVTGAPTNLRMPSVLEAQINKLRAEIDELTRPSEQAVTEAEHE